jgi:XTP/dITP diphosphohydrolase
MKLPDTIVMASGNPGKTAEISALLAHLDVRVVPQSEFGVSAADESGATFADNAVIKAKHAAAATGLPAIADDSGLCVDVLDGRPGVRSARYAGEDASDDSNIDKLLAELDGVREHDRNAEFQCVACFVYSEDAEPLLANGRWRGRILKARSGNGGFGYDPVFFDPELGKSAAELSADEKNASSHRGKALRALADLLGATPA